MVIIDSALTVVAKLLELFPFVKKSMDKKKQGEVTDELRDAIANNDIVNINELVDNILRNEKRPTDFTGK